MRNLIYAYSFWNQRRRTPVALWFAFDSWRIKDRTFLHVHSNTRTVNQVVTSGMFFWFQFHVLHNRFVCLLILKRLKSDNTAQADQRLCLSHHVKTYKYLLNPGFQVPSSMIDLTLRSIVRAILYNYWLLRHWIWCNIDQRIPILTEAKPRSILVFSGQYYIISNASIVNNSPRSILVFSGQYYIISNASIVNNCFII